MTSLQIYKSRGITYARIVESYRKEGNKYPSTRTLKNLGRVDKLEQEDPQILDKIRASLREDREAAKIVEQ